MGAVLLEGIAMLTYRSALKISDSARRRRKATLVGMVAVLLPTMGFAAPLAMAGPKASTVSVLDYSQCQNGPAGTVQLACDRWGNGILNTSNSHYAEDQVTPQRLLMSTTSGSVNKVTIRYMTKKGSANVHAYDSLATWDFTQRDAEKCQGLKAADCPAGPESSKQMVSDPNVVNPAAVGVSNRTDAHELPPESRQWKMFGGTITDATQPEHSTDPTDPGSDYAKVTVTFTANGTRALLLFGGHLAASTGVRGWGPGLGAANISGGPYHIILDSINGASVGSRDNQIMAGAILPGSSSFTVVKTASPANPVEPGDTVTYTITVTNNGDAAGATTFVDNFDDRLTPSTPTSVPLGGSCTREPVANPPTDKLFNCETSTIAAGGGTQVFTYTAVIPDNFSDGAGTGGCGPGEFPVLNKVVLATGDGDDALVCVTAAPKFIVEKTANPPTAGPGTLVTYTIKISNIGDAAGSTGFTDNFDDRLSPSTPTAVPTGGSCSREASTTPPSDKLFTCTSGVIAAHSSQTWTYTALMPTTFTGSPGGETCSAGPTPPASYPVRNVVVLTNGEDDDAVVCVPAAPSFTVVKTFSPANPAKPGDTITYTITVTNSGKASGSTTFNDNFDDRIDPTTPVPSPAGGSCTLNSPNGDDQFDCTTGTIDPNQSQTWTYTGTMPTKFTGDPGGNGCKGAGPGQEYPVRNVVVLANGFNDDAVVCVNAEPELTVVKTASPATANPNQTVTYTIVVSNTGDAPGSTTWSDNFDDRLTPSSATTPGGPNCAPGATAFTNCATGTIEAGGSRTWTYTAAMPGSFTGTPGGDGCPAGPTPPAAFPVRNVVVLASGDDDDAVVCVPAAPTFTVEKTADPTTAVPGQTVTYTIKVTNGGTAAGSTTWSDDFDNRLTPSSATTPGGPNCSPGAGAFTNCATGTIEAKSSKTWTYTAAMPDSFTGTPGGNGCNPAGEDQQYPVRNVVVLANNNTDDAVVCVPAAPEFTVVKTADPTNAQAGQTVTYTIKVTNSGDAAGSTTWSDDFDNRLTPSSATTPGGPNCSPAAGACTDCATGTINAGASKTWTYTAAMPDKFSGAPGGSGCTPAGNGQQYPVRNVAVLDNGDNDDAVVCVAAAPNLTLVKSVQKETDAEGHETLTYTLTYNNTGAAEATTATITETVPAGTTYVSCTGGCTVDGDTVTWTVGPIAPKTGTGSVTMTVAVTTHSSCDISNTAQISTPGFNGGNPVNSNTLVTPVTPSPDPDNANASGNAFGALVTTHGLLNVTTTKLSHAESSQHGVGGPSGTSDTLLTASVPAVLTASALRTTSTSEVTKTPPRAGATSTSEVLNLCIVRIALVCTVESSTVRAVARAEASGTGASFSAAGSTIENLKVVGAVTPVDLNQTTTIPLAALVFGAGSYVAINERIGGTSLSGGAYRSDLEVNMIRVHITGALGVQAVDVTVAHAEAHADFPQLKLCGPQVNRNVSGHAFVAHAAVLPPLVSATVGFVGIPSSGGSESQNLAAASLFNNSLLTTGVATSRSLGSIGANSAASGSRAQVAGVCLLRFPTKPTQCVVTADVLKAVSVSNADSSGATSSDQVSATDKTEFVNLKVRLVPDGPLIAVPINPAPNTVINLLGIGYLVLNEQVCDDGDPVSATNPRCSGANHSGLTVRAVHLVLLRSFGAFSPGVEVIVAEAHSDAGSS
jgi:uncharacterized repeat protein (TIGR01451 family)/fimbrial isopeptide formation D2 family protein